MSQGVKEETDMKKAYIIGISGGSSSGKSTFTGQLAKMLADLKLKVFHMDEYYRDSEQRPVIKGIYNGKQYVDDNHPLALNLDRFHEDVEAALTEDWDVIIAEGIFALWDEKLLPLLDFKLYVDCDADERLIRRIKRHLSFGEELGEITERYVQAVQPRHMEYVEPTKWRADLILNGFQMSGAELELVAGWVRRNIADM